MSELLDFLYKLFTLFQKSFGDFCFICLNLITRHALIVFHTFIDFSFVSFAAGQKFSLILMCSVNFKQSHAR